LTVRGISDVRQTEMHTDKTLVPESRCFGAKIATQKQKRT